MGDFFIILQSKLALELGPDFCPLKHLHVCLDLLLLGINDFLARKSFLTLIAASEADKSSAGIHLKGGSPG